MSSDSCTRSTIWLSHVLCAASCAHLHDKRACVETRCNVGRVWRCHGSSPWDGYGYDVVRGGWVRSRVPNVSASHHTDAITYVPQRQRDESM